MRVRLLPLAIALALPLSSASSAFAIDEPQKATSTWRYGQVTRDALNTPVESVYAGTFLNDVSPWSMRIRADDADQAWAVWTRIYKAAKAEDLEVKLSTSGEDVVVHFPEGEETARQMETVIAWLGDAPNPGEVADAIPVGPGVGISYDEPVAGPPLEVALEEVRRLLGSARVDEMQAEIRA